MPTEIRLLHEALLDLIGVTNSPRPDAALIEAAGIPLDRALFPLLVRIARRGPIGVVELAELVGRDHSTVSRQVAKLARLGLITRRAARGDRRVRQAAITDKGLAMSAALDAAREKLIGPMLARWSRKDRRDLVRLLRKLADDALAWSGAGDS
ncbi:MAG TPA: MarR family transcriptional regulator [Candidatus Sulfotelmatobacter sp.]|nr:MarR family transcriptional regulator [Candidatus Sulfotelmatobacter sp.]